MVISLQKNKKRLQVGISCISDPRIYVIMFNPIRQSSVVYSYECNYVLPRRFAGKERTKIVIIATLVYNNTSMNVPVVAIIQ